MNDDEAEALADIGRRQRVYAPLREGGAKEHKELGVVTDWLEALAREDDARYANPRTADQDPPDCLVQVASGAMVGVEVAELVCQEAVAINERARPAPGQRPALGDMVHAQWDKPSFIGAVAALVAKKDGKAFVGGPYAELILLLHTDEPLLAAEECHGWLTRHTFASCRQLTDAYFVHSYQPLVGYPITKLTLGGA